jgi:twitching motility protein PilT
MPKIDELLAIVKSANATDLHLVSGSVPMVRLEGQLERTQHRELSHGEIKQLIYELLSDQQIRRFERSGDLDLSYGIPDLARFRLNIYQTMSGIGAAIRIIPDQPRTLSELGFPDAVAKLAESKSGLVLVTGPTNSGKTTTLAAMVEHINANFSRHIITLEDPIEYIHANKNSLISQRQIGTHSDSFAAALRAALREDPDVVLVGEMRDIKTISLAITAAETGLLVMGALHTSSATATVDRIIDVFPADQQQQIRIMLADSISGIVCQQLLKRHDGNGRVVAYELMLRSTPAASKIRECKSHQLGTVIRTGRKRGMQLLDNHLRKLAESGIISATEAIRCANEPSRFYSMLPKEQTQEVGA